MAVNLEQSAKLYLIRLEGEIKIASAAGLRTLLLQALASGKELRFDMEQATELDVTALQLLWATGREARRSGTGCTLRGRVPEDILSAAIAAGFETFPVGVNPG
jgi:anti-anti-sigma regulatory factor